MRQKPHCLPEAQIFFKACYSGYVIEIVRVRGQEGAGGGVRRAKGRISRWEGGEKRITRIISFFFSFSSRVGA